MPFIKLDHVDTDCLIALLEELDADERTEQENNTLDKLKMIRRAQATKHNTNVRTADSRFDRTSRSAS